MAKRKEEVAPELKKYLEIYKKISKLLCDENVNVQSAMIILSTMSEALYKYMINNPEAFADGTPLDKILGLEGDNTNGNTK